MWVQTGKEKTEYITKVKKFIDPLNLKTNKFPYGLYLYKVLREYLTLGQLHPEGYRVRIHVLKKQKSGEPVESQSIESFTNESTELTDFRRFLSISIIFWLVSK